MLNNSVSSVDTSLRRSEEVLVIWNVCADLHAELNPQRTSNSSTCLPVLTNILFSFNQQFNFGGSYMNRFHPVIWSLMVLMM